MFGGALTGVWRADAWRLQPTLAGTVASETLSGYIDSSGMAFFPQTLSYGRLTAGPEVGYTFGDPDGVWTLEPFAMVRLQVDFSSTQANLVNGTTVFLRPGTLASGATGVGLQMRMKSGIYLRAQGNYESIGVSGLDVWSGTLRGGMTF